MFVRVFYQGIFRAGKLTIVDTPGHGGGMGPTHIQRSENFVTGGNSQEIPVIIGLSGKFPFLQ